MNGIRLIDHGMDPEGFAVLESAVTRRLRERGCEAAGIPVTVETDPALQEDAYRVEASRDAVRIRAGGTAGAFSGAGDYLRRCAFDGSGGFRPFAGSFGFTPVNPIHGMYFASHFRNFYEEAPVDEVRTLIEDLALQGCNAVMAWYDMHQYAGTDDPASREMIARLKAVFRHASLTGMKTVFGTLANESFRSSDPALRAEWWAQNGYFARPVGHYHVEICPNRPGGLDEILRQRRRVLEAFRGVRIDYVSIWPYDQGGCTCEKCSPWGANGFLKTLNALRSLYAEILPDAKLLCSTWYFDRFVREWDGFRDAFETGKYDYVEYLFGYFANGEPIPDFIREGRMPGGKRMIAFPEISMHGCSPWGGFGANPMPGRLEENYRENGGLYCGALPYSEGIFEDVNKAMMLAFYSGRLRTADEVLREYARFEFCLDGEAAGKFVRMVRLLEGTLARRSENADGEPVAWEESGLPWEDLRFVLSEPDGAAEAERLASEIDRDLPEKIRNGWRWQILRLRAAIDCELVSNGMRLTGRIESRMRKLTEIYHARNASWPVTPLTRAAVARGKDGQNKEGKL